MMLLLASAVLGQSLQTVGGRVTDAASGAALPYVTCKVVDARGKLITYATTNAKGHYSVDFATGKANAIVFSLIGYAKQSFKVSALTGRLDVAMRQEDVQVKEVVVKSKPIVTVGDTVKYNVASFAGKGDQYIEDVLRKMPGIEVKEDGNISYKGKSINKLLIEGHDLLGSRYNQATQNLPAEAVAQVQVVENDQPINALKGILHSDKATLNLKLRNGYKTKPFGEAVVGEGLGEKHLYDSKLTLVALSRRWQALLTGRAVNNGTNLGYAMTPHIDVMDPEGYSPLPKPILTTDYDVRYAIAEGRYLKNRSQTGGLNLLFGVGRYAHLRTNITYYGPADKSSDSTSNAYGGDYTFLLYESNRRRKRLHDTHLDMTYELNAPNVYVSNALKVALSSLTNANSLNSNSLRQEEQRRSHPLTIGNHLGVNVKRGRQLLTLHSLVRYVRRPENMDVDSLNAQTDWFPTERLTSRELLTRNSIATSVRLGKNALGLKYLLEYRAGWLDVHSPDSLWVSTVNRRMLNSLQAYYTFKYPSGNVSVSLPLQWYGFHGSWGGGKEESSNLRLAPVVAWKHQFSPFLTWNMRGSVNEVPSEDVVSGARLFVSYRNMRFSPQRLGWNRTSSLTCTLNYTNLINMLTCNVLVTHSWSRADCYEDYQYTPSITYIHTVWGKNRAKVLYGSLLVSKSWLDCGLAVNASANYNRNERTLSQNGLLAEVRQNIFTANASVAYDKIKWMEVRNTFTFNLAWQDKTQGNVSHTMRSFFNDLRVSAYPVEQLRITTTITQTTTQTSQHAYCTNVFVDLTTLYKLDKRWSLSLHVSNLLNRKQYVEASFSGLNRHSLTLPLRGREVMMKISFKI